MYVGSPDGYRIEENMIAAGWDVNADGRPDLYFATDKNNNGNSLAGTERYIQYQQPDGSFLKSRIEFVDNQEFRNAAQKFIRENSYDYFQMFADIPINGTPVLSNLTREIDFNKDGLPDLLSDNGVLLNMGNNKFAFAEAPAGQIFVKDLNGDFLSDMILYDEDAQTVTSRIYLGNGEIKEQVVLKNFKISGIWCYDFDRDGDVDILIPLNYQSSIGYAFLVFCENQGEGKFKIHENYYEDKWNFLHCADVNNDGYYDLIAEKPVDMQDIDAYGPGTFSCPTYFLLTGKNDKTFNEPVQLFQYMYKDAVTHLQDFDNDGIYELSINNSAYGSVKVDGYIYNFENVPANQRPNKPAAPTFALNSETGKLKISWNVGSDAETSAVDLTYSLRIGSAPGKSDIWFPYANSDGSRVTFTPGSMGSNLDKIVDVSGWQPGNYYISIQTVDPMYSGSVFSDEVIYTHEALTPKFTLSDSRIFTVDTLTVSLAGSKLAGYTYNWNIPDGQIIEETDCSLKVVFSQGGEKTIALQLTAANGEVLPAYEQQVSVLPNKLVKNSSDFSSYSFLDFDGNGILDATSGNGLHSNNGQGIFTKIPKLYNSDLQITGTVGILDMNMNGLPDMLARTNKGNTLINEGDFAFDVRNENFTWNGSYYASGISDVYTKGLYDFNNDGWTDYSGNNGSDGYIFKNMGGNYEFSKTNIRSEGICYDWNNDGLWDAINTSGTKLTVYINKGNFEFETTEIDLSHLSNLYSSYSFADIKDMNNDGYPDLIFRKQYRTYITSVYNYTYNYYVAFGNKENRYENPVEVISDAGNIAAIQDMDNNGFLDIILSPTDLHSHSIVYFYPDGEVKVIRDANRESLYFPSNSSFYSDLNGDNIPDFSTEISFQTKIRNTPPQAPVNVRARQTDAGLLIEWDAAQDAETPYVQMRYNVSVKKRGANVGDENAFIVSPLNGLKDEAATVPELPYRTATRMEIPMERIPAGSYEIQVQSIDLWNAHSLLSAPFTIETSTQLSVQAPSNACIDVPVAITARSSEPINGSALLWDWDGGTVVSSSDAGPYQVKWSTPGVKTVKASINGTPVSTAIMVGQGEFYDLTFKLPYTVLADVAVAFTLPEVLMNPAIAFHFNTSDKKISISRRTGTRECKVVFPESGGTSQWIELQIETEGCASPVYRQSVTVKSGIATPKISLVNIDEATGKNRIIWDKYNVNLSSEVTEMLIYKEGSRYNQFNLIGRAIPGSGEFIDLMSNPQITTSRYLIAYNTIYSAQSNQSVPHRSTHLMLNRGMANSINLYWTPYEGGIIESYRIYRGETPETLSLLVEIPGSANSYTDLMPPEGLFYYAIEYDQVYNTQWEMENTISQSSAFRASQAGTQLISGRSNAVSVVNAQNITMVQSINIMVMEETLALNKEQSELHLYTEIFPVTADYKVVNWLIVSGAEYAYITSQGTLAAIRNTQSGTVTVRAAAVDGSNITATRSFTVEAFEDGTAIVQPEVIPEISFKIYPNPVSDGFFISGIHETATLRLINLSGNVILSKQVSDGEYVPVSSLAAGIYIVRLQTGNGTMEKKLIKR
jgi:hypothetical protein